jgi:SAM-dependent methyltransferase
VTPTSFDASNVELWDELAEIHRTVDAYSEAVLDSPTGALRELELTALGDVAGKRLLHSHCHIGLDTISWNKLGAMAHGIDYSRRSIEIARESALRSGSSATFEVADACRLPVGLSGYDLAVATYGVVEWTADLDAWIQGIARALTPGGLFLMIDTHPASCAVELSADQRLVLIEHFFGPAPVRVATRGSYADRRKVPRTRHRYKWPHSISDVFGALRRAGFSVLDFREFEFAHYKKFDCMTERKRGYWFLPDAMPKVPFTFQLVASKQM